MSHDRQMINTGFMSVQALERCGRTVELLRDGEQRCGVKMERAGLQQRLIGL
jgi:hypothetical protein